MVVVQRVLVTVVDVVHVADVVHRLVTAAVAMLVLGGGVLRRALVLVVVVIVLRMAVLSVQVVDMVAMLKRLVAAATAVPMLSDAVLGDAVQVRAQSSSPSCVEPYCTRYMYVLQYAYANKGPFRGRTGVRVRVAALTAASP